MIDILPITIVLGTIAVSFGYLVYEAMMARRGLND